jgi:CspA family cold shock protein
LNGRRALHGTVTAFDEARGLGEVTRDDGATYPFHCVEIADGTRTIDVGTAVVFEVVAKLGRYEAAHLVTARREREGAAPDGRA